MPMAMAIAEVSSELFDTYNGLLLMSNLSLISASENKFLFWR